MSPNIGAYFQCHKNPFATYKTLESFRNYYPTNSVVLVSDNGYDYTEMAKYFDCIYVHRTQSYPLIYDYCNEIDKNINGKHISWVFELLSNIQTNFSLVKEDYILWLEDDVIINGQFDDPCNYDINGFNPNQYWNTMKNALSEVYPIIDPSKTYTFSGHGGSIFNKPKILEYLTNNVIINDILINWRKYNLTSNIACDFLLSLLVHLNGGTVGSLNGAADGPWNEIIPSIKLQHQYKKYYGVSMPNELSYLVNTNNHIKQVNIIPIGPDCNVAITLLQLKLRRYSYPWDWARTSSIDEIIDVVRKGKEFNVSDWDNLKDIPYKLPHDVLNNTHGDYEAIFEGDLLEKYKRRFSRFFEHIYGDTPTYLIRYGDGTNLNILQELLPKCTIIHIQDGHPDSIETKSIIKNTLQTTLDPYSIIIYYIACMTENMSYSEFKNTVLDNHPEIEVHLYNVFQDTDLKTKTDIAKYASKRIQEITGQIYCAM